MTVVYLARSPYFLFMSRRKMSAGPIIEFFKPLHIWLKEENERNGAIPGW